MLLTALRSASSTIIPGSNPDFSAGLPDLTLLITTPIPGSIPSCLAFSSESSSNHIFVSTPKSNNHKMRVGDSIDSATLMKIESTGAVFAYQGETAFLNIGG